MCPRAAEGVPVLDVKTPDRSWIVGEETVVDDLVKMGMFWALDQETWMSLFQKPAFVSCSTKKALSTFAQDNDQE